MYNVVVLGKAGLFDLVLPYFVICVFLMQKQHTQPHIVHYARCAESHLKSSFCMRSAFEVLEMRWEARSGLANTHTHTHATLMHANVCIALTAWLSFCPSVLSVEGIVS